MSKNESTLPPNNQSGNASDGSLKKKKKSKKVADDGEEDGEGEGVDDSGKMDTETLCRSIAQLSASSTPSQTHTNTQISAPPVSSNQHAFWATQPMRKPDGIATTSKKT